MELNVKNFEYMAVNGILYIVECHGMGLLYFILLQYELI